MRQPYSWRDLGCIVTRFMNNLGSTSMAVTRLFIAGATGHTGRELVRLAAAQELEVTAHVRPDSPRLDHWRQHFAAFGANVDTTPWQTDALRDTLQRLTPEVVFGLLGTTRARAKRESQAQGAAINYEAIDYALTAQLIGVAASIEPPPRFVYLSASGVPAASEPKRGSYMHARWKVERVLTSGQLPFTIARPSFISGPGRDEARPGERIGSALVDGALAIAGVLGGHRLQTRYRSTTSTILATALLRLACDPSMAGRIVESEDLR
jgi:nucleoside-diphosphate-sugar epimerase